MAMSFAAFMIAKFSTSSVIHTTRAFLDTKAELYLRSASEYALMALQGHNFNNGDLKEINLSFPGYEANIRFFYFRTDCKNSNCVQISTQDTNMSVLVYVTLVSTNPNFHIRKVRVTLQNP